MIYDALLAEEGREWTVSQLAERMPAISMEAVRTTLYLLLGESLMVLVPRRTALIMQLTSEGATVLLVKIGAGARVFAEGGADDPPVVCVQAGQWQVLFYPSSWAEGEEPTQAEADRASDIVLAFSQWRNRIYERVKARERING